MIMLHVGEIFNMANAADDKATVLRENVTPGLKMIVDINFKTKLNGLVNGYPVGVKLDEFAPYGLTIQSLNAITRQFPRMFMNASVPDKKKNEFLLQILETLHPDEADILVFAKDQALVELFPWATEETFKDAGLL